MLSSIAMSVCAVMSFVEILEFWEHVTIYIKVFFLGGNNGRSASYCVLLFCFPFADIPSVGFKCFGQQCVVEAIIPCINQHWPNMRLHTISILHFMLFADWALCFMLYERAHE